VRRLCQRTKSLPRDINFSNVYATHELGEGENPELNIASHVNANKGRNLLYDLNSAVVLSMVKVWLLEVYCLLSSRIGIYLGRDGIYDVFSLLNGGRENWETVASYVRNIIKNKSRQPKESIEVREATPGLPKEGNLYGNRVTVVPIIADNTSIFFFFYYFIFSPFYITNGEIIIFPILRISEARLRCARPLLFFLLIILYDKKKK